MTNSVKNITNSKIKVYFSINDIRDKYFDSLELQPNERLALKNYDRFRITELNKQNSEKDFHKRYLQLQVMANLTPYEEFLEEKYYL